jgi:hypothetical protein
MFDGKGSGRELFAAGLLTFGGWRSGGTGRGHFAFAVGGSAGGSVRWRFGEFGGWCW